MPSFTAKPVSFTAKGRVLSDGEQISVSSADGYTVTSTLSSYSAFLKNPSRSATGVWSATMKDPAFKVLDFNVVPLLPSTNYISVQALPLTTVSATGQLVLNWVFNSAGTPSDLPTVSGVSFLIYVVYSEETIA